MHRWSTKNGPDIISVCFYHVVPTVTDVLVPTSHCTHTDNTSDAVSGTHRRAQSSSENGSAVPVTLF